MPDQPLRNNGLEEFVEVEALHSEQHKDAPLKSGTRVSRPGGKRGVVFSIRLFDSEHDALVDQAHQRGLPPSRLARELIVEGLEASGRPGGPGEIARTLRSIAAELEKEA
jgi:hypothetical protein